MTRLVELFCALGASIFLLCVAEKEVDDDSFPYASFLAVCAVFYALSCFFNLIS